MSISGAKRKGPESCSAFRAFDVAGLRLLSASNREQAVTPRGLRRLLLQGNNNTRSVYG
jgi:hypothetical protein